MDGLVIGGRGRRRARQEEEPQHDHNKGLDRISKIPDELAHHILSFLPTEDVARTSALSRRWKSIWRSLPSADFNETRFRHLGLEECKEGFLYSMSIFYLLRNTSPLIQKIRVFSIHPHDHRLQIFLDYYISLSLWKSKLLELDITIDNDNSSTYENSARITYSLSDRVFPYGTHLTSLKLKACYCGPCENVYLPSLKTMSLIYVLISDEMLQRLITNSPKLEDLNIEHCFDMVVLRVFNPSLRRLVVASRGDLMLLEMDVPNLSFFYYHGVLSINHNLNNNEIAVIPRSEIVQFSSPNGSRGFESLKNMILSHVRMQDLTLRSMLRSCPSLETVRLHCCFFGLVPFDLNPRLEVLVMENCRYDTMLLNNETLRGFAMTNHSFFPFSRSLNIKQFDNVKTLALLGNVHFESERFDLTSGPFLETLIVRSCFLLERIRLTSSSLKNLTVESCFYLVHAAVNTPNLEFFSYGGFLLNFSELIMPDDVVIKLRLVKETDDYFTEDLYDQRLWNFYRVFEYKRYISIESEEAETIIVPRSIGLNPTIRFIEEFKVKTVVLLSGMTYVTFLLDVLNLAFCFETLIMNMVSLELQLKFAVPSTMAQLMNEMDWVLVYKHDCIKSHLTEAEVMKFEGNAYDMDLVGYLLGNARFLRSLTITFRDQLPPDVISAATIAIISIPRAFPNVAIRFKYN